MISCLQTSTRLVSSFFFYCPRDHRDLHSFPTRRSSDLNAGLGPGEIYAEEAVETREAEEIDISEIDRKSTRLNSSHTVISYAVFCLKKKRKTHVKASRRQRRLLGLTLSSRLLYTHLAQC